VLFKLLLHCLNPPLPPTCFRPLSIMRINSADICDQKPRAEKGKKLSWYYCWTIGWIWDLFGFFYCWPQNGLMPRSCSRSSASKPI